MKNQLLADHIVQWLDHYLTESKLEGFVVGVSGGIDSALTSTLCALTGKPTLCLEMPIQQATDQVSRAEIHNKWLKQNHPNVSVKRVDLNKIFDAFQQLDSKDINSSERLLALANSRSRLRMTTLYYYAGVNRALVAGTGNKVEDFGVGFYTKYGDGGVDLSPIADLMKTEVRMLAQHLGIDKSIVQAPPTDGLWDDGRTDEDQLGASYKELEWAMHQHELGIPPDKFKNREKEVLEVFLKHHNANKHKMESIPVCIIPDSFKKIKD